MINSLHDVTQLEDQARRIETPCGPGALVWHVWGAVDRPPLLLLHGGSGSWTHWVCNIAPLVAAGWQVLVPDMPGFGDSAAPPDGEDANVLPAWLDAGLQQLIGHAALPVVGFSFGALVAGLWAQSAPSRISRLVLVGRPGLSAERLPPLPLRRWERAAPGLGRDAVHHHNLLQLMLAAEASATPLAVALHAANVERDRLRRRLMLTDALVPLLPTLACPVQGIWGREDVLYCHRLPLIGRVLATAPHFDGLHFCRLLDSFDPHSLLDLTRHGGAEGASRQRADSTIGRRNLLPAPFLGPRFEAAHCTVLFSATLAPQAFYADALGLLANRAWVDVDAPFRPEQLQVRIVREVSTRYADRAASLGPIAVLLAAQYRRQPGLYLAFFSSFDYLQQAAEAFAAAHPEVPQWRQARQMDEAGRSAFLARFTPGQTGIGFAVLGGVFAEGIDLPGSRLIGAFIATLGLPQVNPLNEALRQRQQAAFGAGYAYTYLYPGLRKVVQAAGRVIRTLDDSGSLHLIDDRFDRPEVRRLLPRWWQLQAAEPAR